MKFTAPLSQNPGVAVLKATWVRDDPEWRSLEDDILKEINGLFGCPQHHYSFTPIGEHDVPATNHLFLPSPEETSPVSPWKKAFGSPLPQPEYRSLALHVSHSVGSSLVMSESPHDLFRAILDALLGMFMYDDQTMFPDSIQVGWACSRSASCTATSVSEILCVWRRH